MIASRPIYQVVRIPGAILLSVALVGVFLCSALALAQDESNETTRRALLIGINKYASEKLQDLQGAVNDVETIRRLLESRFGFAPKNITTLLDEQATRKAILHELGRLVEATGKDDTVYIHFSGHGSQVEDRNNDESEDGMDETLVPHDGRTDDVRDITDDEFAAVLDRLPEQAALIVLDCCHSGTATRGATEDLLVRGRSVPADTRVNLYPDNRTRAVVTVLEERQLVMTGAAASQKALDAPVEAGRYHGLLSYALFQSLERAGPDASARSVFAGVERTFRKMKPKLGYLFMPEPQLEGHPDRMDRPLFGRGGGSDTGGAVLERSASRTWADAVRSGKDQILLVGAASLRGMPGSIWALYPDGETDFRSGEALATAEVLKVHDNNSQAKVLTPGVKLSAKTRAVLLAPAPSMGRVPIRFLNVPRDQAETLEAGIRTQVPSVEFVGSGDFARFYVKQEEGFLWVLGADAERPVERIAADSQSKLIERLSQVFSRSVSATELLTLENPYSNILLDVKVASYENIRSEKVTTRGITLVAETEDPTLRYYKKGDAHHHGNSLQLEIEASDDCFLTIVDVDSEGSVNLLFPNTYSEENSFYPEGKISGGRTILIPDSLEPDNRAGFHWGYSEPPGRDTIQVFASTDLETAETIRDYVTRLQDAVAEEGNGVATRGAGIESSPKLADLQEALLPVATRGISIVTDEDETTARDAPPPSDWNSASVTVLVEED